MSLLKQIEQLKYAALREHYYCEDSWYSCPKAEGGCFDDRFEKDECRCGADEHNGRVEQFYTKIKLDLTEFSEFGYVKL